MEYRGTMFLERLETRNMVTSRIVVPHPPGRVFIILPYGLSQRRESVACLKHACKVLRALLLPQVQEAARRSKLKIYFSTRKVRMCREYKSRMYA